MADGASKDAVFQVASPAGGTVYFDLSPYLTGVSWSMDGKAIDTSTFGNAYKKFIRGQGDAKLSCEGIFDPVVGTCLKVLGTAGATGYKYYPQGTAGQLMSGSCLLTSYSPPAKLDEAVTFTAEFQNTGTPSVA